MTSCKDPLEADKGRIVADAVLINGKIITMDPADSIVEAVAVKNGKIAARGPNSQVKSLIGPGTLVIDLKGLAATPGLIDSHNHFPGASSLYVLDVSYINAKSIAEIAEMVGERARALKPGEWILGAGWDEAKLDERRLIYASDLDPVAPRNPVWLTHSSLHFGVANSCALRLAGVTRETPNPDGGIIDRHADGTPTGILRETAMDLVRRLIPPFTEEQEVEGLKHMCRKLNEEGITAVIDPGMGLFEAASDGNTSKWRRYERLLGEDALTVRVFALWLSPRSEAEAQALIENLAALKGRGAGSQDLLMVGGVKIFLDGVPGNAWVYEEWNKGFHERDQGNFGAPVIDPEVFRRMVKMYHEAGLHVEVHAVGDRAVDWALKCFLDALWEKPVKGLRHGIIHADAPTDRAIEWMSALQKGFDAGYVYVQPSLMWWLGDYSASYYGPKRSSKYCPLRSYLDRGIIWGSGSDHPVNPSKPWLGVWSSVARRSFLGVYGDVFGREQSVDVRTALRSYTLWGAYLMFMEDKIGSIEVGKYADIAVWSKDPYTAPVDELKDIKCLMTMFNGKIVFKSPDAPIEIRAAQPKP
ncbi:MAG: amidohydrolase [Desulfurococcaceae archaeon]